MAHILERFYPESGNMVAREACWIPSIRLEGWGYLSGTPTLHPGTTAYLRRGHTHTHHSACADVPGKTHPVHTCVCSPFCSRACRGCE